LCKSSFICLTELLSFIGELRLKPYGLGSHKHLFEGTINMEGYDILWWAYKFATNEHCWHWRVAPHAPQSPLHFPPIRILVKLMHRRACSKLIEQLRDAVAHVTWTLGEYNCCFLWCQLSYSIHCFHRERKIYDRRVIEKEEVVLASPGGLCDYMVCYL